VQPTKKGKFFLATKTGRLVVFFFGLIGSHVLATGFFFLLKIVWGLVFGVISQKSVMKKCVWTGGGVLPWIYLKSFPQ